MLWSLISYYLIFFVLKYAYPVAEAASSKNRKLKTAWYYHISWKYLIQNPKSSIHAKWIMFNIQLTETLQEAKQIQRMKYEVNFPIYDERFEVS